MVMMSEWSVWGKVTVCSVGFVIFSPPCPAPAGPWTPDPRIWASNPPAWRAYSGPDESAGALATDWTVYSSSYVAVEDHLLFIVSDLCVSKPPVTHAHTVSDKLNWRLQTHTAGRWSGNTKRARVPHDKLSGSGALAMFSTHTHTFLKKKKKKKQTKKSFFVRNLLVCQRKCVHFLCVL